MLTVGTEVKVGKTTGKVVGHAVVNGEDEINVIEFTHPVILEGTNGEDVMATYILARFTDGKLEIL